MEGKIREQDFEECPWCIGATEDHRDYANSQTPLGRILSYAAVSVWTGLHTFPHATIALPASVAVAVNDGDRPER